MSKDKTEFDEIFKPRRGRRIRRLLFWGMIVAVIGVFAMHGRGGGEAPAVQYETEKAALGDLTITVTATGNLEPTNQVQVGSEQSGIVESVEVDYNDRITEGQVLARIDPTRLEAQILQAQAGLESAKAQVASAQATVEEARNELNRLKELERISSSKTVTQRDLDTAQAKLDRAVAGESQARAQVSQAEASLETFQTDLSKLEIRSPINGIVLSRSIDPGQTVAASFQAPELFLLAEDLSKMELHVDVDEADVGMVEAGQAAMFTVDAYPGRQFPAVIRRVNYGSETTEGVVTYRTVLDVENAELILRPGMTATATITVQELHDAVLIPNAVLRFAPPPEPDPSAEAPPGGGNVLMRILPRPPAPTPKARRENGLPGQHTVWTLEGDQLAPIQISTGLTDGTMTEVVDGIAPDTVLVTAMTGAPR